MSQDTKSRIQPEKGVGLPATTQDAISMIENAQEGCDEGEELWFAIMNHQDQMVGFAVIDWMDERQGNVQYCVYIFEEYKRNHYARATSEIILKYLFHERRFHKVGCCVLEGNEAGNAFARSLGMALDAYRDEMFFTYGKYIGEFYYSILREEYDNGIKSRDSYELPYSELGEFSEDIVIDGVLVHKPENPGEERPYFWRYDGIELREMTEEYNMINRQMIYDSEACVYFDSDVKLPTLGKELTDFEKAHLNFGCEDDRIEFAILNSEGEYVGNINVCGLDKKNGKFSYSVYVRKEHRGNSYATKALRIILWYCFNELRMNKMICCVNSGNAGSAAVMRKVGCRVEGVMRENEYYHGQYVDAVSFGLTRAEFMEFNRFCQNHLC
ncbi:MAG: GNAT family protein [Agathobacter sp.]|nr:GNAT family protein [Agathobacter sp.]